MTESLLKKLIDEFENIRNVTVDQFADVEEDAWILTGTADGTSFSVRALAYFLVGHVNHHIVVLNERYLKMI